MALNKNDMDKLSKLAHIHLSDEEKQRFSNELDHVLKHFETLSKLPLHDKLPQNTLLGERQDLRNDHAKKNDGLNMPQNAPDWDEQESSFVVPPIL